MKKLFGFMVLLLVLTGCYKYQLYPSMVDTAQFTKNDQKLRLAILAVANNKDGRRFRRGAYEHELAQRLGDYIEEDVFNRQLAYRDIAPNYKLAIPASMKPSKMAFVDRKQMEAVLEEQDFGQTDRVDENTAAKIGKIKGAQVIMFVSCSLQMSGKKVHKVQEMHKEYYMDWERDKNGKVIKDKNGNPIKRRRWRWISKNKKVNGRQVLRISRRVMVKCRVRMINVSTSEVLYTKNANSQIFEVYAEILQGQRAKLNIKSAAVASLKSLGHRIGRLFYPIVAHGGMFGGAPTDPRKSDDSLDRDLTWN